MKWNVILVTGLILCSGVITAQDQTPAIGVRWGFGVYKPGEFVGYPGKQVTATVMYKDTSGSVFYTEEHSGVLDDFSYLRFTIGKGTNPNPPSGPPLPNMLRLDRICYTVTVQTDNGPLVITGEEVVSAVPKSNAAQIAEHAINSERWGNNRWILPPLSVDEHINTIAPDRPWGFPAWRYTGQEDVVQPIDLTNVFEFGESPSVIDNTPIPVLRIGSGGTPRALVFGSELPEEMEHYVAVCNPPEMLNVVRHVMAVIAKRENPPSPIARNLVAHNTAAIYADNTASEMSAGVLAEAQTWGLYGTAQNGVVGITAGLSNGAGTTGFVGQAPDTGGFKYGLYGSSNNLTLSWAAAIFGNGFHTGTWSMTSDARLKTAIRTQIGALDKVMQLRPAQYNYLQDTPYSLPAGLHHGFIAQEVETVFPELVSDVVMPVNGDPQKIYTSETEQYKAINYIEMITILTGALQELNTTLNAKIDAQAAEIAELRSMIDTLKKD